MNFEKPPYPGQRRRFVQFSAIYVVLWIATWYASGLLQSLTGVSLWFLPAGLRFFCLLLFGWSGVLLELMVQFIFALLQITSLAGTPIADFLSTNTLWRLFNLLASLAANALVILPLRRWLLDSRDFTQPARSALFLAAALTASALSALAGTFGIVKLGLIEPAQFANVFPSWMVGDFIGIITLAPLLVVRAGPGLKHYLQHGRWNRRRQAREIGVSPDRPTVLIVVPALLLVFGIPWHLNLALHFPLIALLLLLPLAGVALHYGQRGTVLAVLLLDGGLVLLIALFDQRGEAMNYQVVMIAIALVGLWLGAAVERYRTAEASRSESEASFRATFEQAAVGIAMVATAGRWLQVNQKLCDIVGYSRDELLSKTFQEITHPDDIGTDLDRVRQLLAGEKPTYTLEKRYLRKDGRIVWINLTAALTYSADGSPAYFVSVIEDIDSRKAAELALLVSEGNLKEAQRLAGVGNWRYDLRSGRRVWSEEINRIFGRDPDLPALAEADLEAYFTAASWARLSAAVTLCALEGTSYACDAELVRADGTPRWITARGQAERDADGQVTALHGTLQDISGLKEAAEALRELNAGLEQRVVQRTAELHEALQESMATRQRLQVEIDQHRRTENRLHNVETTLTHATRIAAMGAWSVEIDDFEVAENNPMIWSTQMYHLFDYSPEEVPSPSLEHFLARVHPDDRKTLIDLNLGRQVGERAWQKEFRLVLGNGRETLVVESAEVVFDDSGKTASIHGAIRDITEQRQAEARLAQYRDDLEGMVDERTEQLLIANSEQMRLNRALRLLSDCTISLARAKDESRLLDDLCRLVVDSGGYLMGGVWFAQADRTKSVCSVAQYGDPDGVLENLRVSWDGDQTIGCGPAGTAIRTGYTQFIENCQDSQRMLPWQDVFHRIGCRSIVALPLIIENHVLGAFALYSTRPAGFDSDEIGILEELASNLSYGLQSLRARNELEQYQKRLEERVAERTHEIALLNSDLAAKASDAESANRAKSSFLSTMSHEIRTPLNAVVGLTGLLADSPLTRRQRDYADKIQLAAQTLRALIDDILDFSRIEAGAIELEQLPFSLCAILRTVAALVSVGIGGKPVEILFDVASNIPDRLTGDAMRVQQILVNLAGNAAKFTETGEIVVAVRCLAREAGQVTLEFSIRDTGIGIPPEQLGQIFEAFAQGDASISRLYGGTGLGLAISARLAALMGSHIAITSAVGQGSEFSFAVSLALADGAPPRTADDVLPGLRILIVDDHPLARTILTEACAAFNWRATARDGAEAGLAELRRSAAEGREYDMLLLDWRMPGIDGIQMLRQANAAPEIGLPLVILMVSTFELEQAAAASDGVYIDSLLVKPTTPASLFDAVVRTHSGELVGSLPPHGKSNRRLSGRRLLVAEDNDLNRLVIEQMLIQAGAEVVLVSNGMAAVDALRSPDARFDAVLMDIQMPVMDGYTATRIIREELERLDLPIVAVTACAQPEDREKSRRAGMAGHIAKPLDVDALLDILTDDRQCAQARDVLAEAPAARATVTLAGIDVIAALKAFGGNQRKYGEILRQFVVGHGGDIEQARALLATGDTKGAASLVHGLCGMASIVHAMEMSHLARAAEGAIGNLDAVPPLFDELQGAMHALGESIGAIDAMIAGP